MAQNLNSLQGRTYSPTFTLGGNKAKCTMRNSLEYAAKRQSKISKIFS